jgi:thiamine biosynthesis lipoprotein
MPTVTLARLGMATRFEIVLHGNDPVALRAAGEEALAEVDRLEDQLSLFRPASEIARLNARAAREPVRVTPSLFAFLQLAAQLHRESGGAFDITIAPLVRCWGFMAGGGHLPDPAALSEARACVGMGLVHLDADERTVRFERPGVMLDLGAIGKGYAVEQAAEILRDGGVASALIHGGTSTIYALGCPPDSDAWKVAIESPPDSAGNLAPGPVVSLRDEAMSVSAVWGKSFSNEGKTFGHVLDPRTGQPAGAARLAAVVLPSATETDALSTALLTQGPPGHDLIANLRPSMRTLLGFDSPAGFQIETRNMSLR